MAETSDSNAKRLDRIEEKLDKLADAMVSMARAEEKINGLKDDHENKRERLNRLSAKLDEIQRAVDNNSRTISIINKFFWIFVTAVSAVVAGQFYMG